MQERLSAILVLVLTLLPSIADAATSAVTTSDEPSTTATSAEKVSTDDVVAGLGGGDFARELGRFTGGGLAWNVRIAFNAYRYFGVEVNYQGLNTSVNSVVLSNGASTGGTTMQQNAFTFNVKASLPIALGIRTLEPYAFAGGGYSRIVTAVLFSVDNTKSSNAAAIPVGGGVSFIFHNNVMVDGRFTYNFLTSAPTSQIETGDSWQAILSVGYRVRSVF
jgi:opacity protein-like surface antigen